MTFQSVALRCIDEDFLGRTERKGWLACQTAGFRLKVGGDVVALAKKFNHTMPWEPCRILRGHARATQVDFEVDRQPPADSLPGDLKIIMVKGTIKKVLKK